MDIVLSGPKVAEQQARNALVAVGLDVRATDHAHGMEALTEGQAESFLTVTGDHPDAAVAAVRSLGYVLRMHFETPEPQPPGIEQHVANELASMRAELAELKARVA